MNKKFSTLAVAAMLATAFTAYAGPGDVVTKLVEGNNGKQYQLRVDGGSADAQFLTLAKDQVTGDIQLKLTNDLTDLGNSLWCVDVTLENAGKNPIFDFINKGNSAVLDVTIGGYTDWTKVESNGTVVSYVAKDVAHVGGEVAGWEFAPVLGDGKTVTMFNSTDKGADFKGDAYALNSYIDSNWAATLVVDGDGNVKVAVVRASDLKNGSLDFGSTGVAQLEFFLQEADAVNLTATQFNTILNTQKETETVKMTFDKDYNNTEVVNPFSTNEFNAEIAEDNLVYLYKTEADGSKNYLRVDTAYANGYGTKFLTFAFAKYKDDKGVLGKGNPAKETLDFLKEQYKFRLNYCPTDDSLSIQVKSAVYKVNDSDNSPEDYKWWRNYGEAGKNAKEYYGRTWKQIFNHGGSYEGLASDDAFGNTNFVKLQDLEIATESRIITVGQEPINTHISFGYGDCAAVASEYTSVADGVYVIKNAKGQVLASPLYDNGAKAMFVSVDEQDPQHMPAYQWVILTNYTQTNSLPTSPVTITNREFPALTSSMQLRQKGGASYLYTLNATNATDVELATTDSLTFEKVADANVQDKYLGYKKMSKDELAVNKYTFNYWHTYAADKFIAQSENDSTLIALTGMDAFKVDTIAADVEYTTSDIKYGYGVDKTDEEFKAIQKRIPGLAQLVRTAYVMSKDGAAWRISNENKFNVSIYANDQQSVNAFYKTNEVDANGQLKNTVPAFFLKENNQVDGKCYHALVVAKWQNNANKVKEYQISDATLKVGVSDDSNATLKSQVLAETRTSAFYVAPDATPLYRRFNSTLEGQAGDGVDTLRFYEKYRNEYLMIEANKNFMVEHIDFLGIDAQDKAQGGLAFIVDTAWVNRGYGHLKPQYLISIDRHDKVGTPGVPCTYEHNHYDNQGNAVDAEHCSHATPAVPGFARGKYLINFERYANADEMVKADDYKWAGYVRAGFKEAVVVADTLYVLRDEFKNLPNEEITIEKLASAEVEALRAWTKAGNDAKDFLSYKYELAGDQHKYATWSMRFVDREKAANEVEADRAFLIESMADEAIAPMENASWLKMQNGCLVLSKKADSKFNEVVTGGDDALIFNVEHVCGDKVAVDNENIAVEGVSVVAGNGQVTIMGAAGKNVTITNILGKVIANQTIASDNATIAVPAGIVAVAVEGEAAVKAIVK